jgi:hypothetical protein
VYTKCDLMGGIVTPGFCDPVEAKCVPELPVPEPDWCCECPVPAPPFPHTTLCFEGAAGLEPLCAGDCVLMPGVSCGPVTEACGGE